MTTTLEILADLMQSVSEISRDAEKLEELVSWLQSETFGGEITTMNKEAQAVMTDFLNLLQQSEIDLMRRKE